MSESTFTIRLEETLKQKFFAAAKASDRTGAQLLRDFMREFVQQQSTQEHDQWFRQQVQVGIESANAGNLMSSNDVEAKFAARRIAVQQKIHNANE